MLEVTGINKTIEKEILRSVTFEAKRGEYFVLLGRSGAGKSILLDIIAGITEPDSGRIMLDGIDITDEKVQKRNIGYVFQDSALFPHMSVRENIAYSLITNGSKKEDRQSRIRQLSLELGLEEFLDRKPETLSSGQAQRVALARALAADPVCLLLDEPLSSLDVQARAELRRILRQVNRHGLTMIHVTHDFEEALSLATRIAVIEDGAISQVGSPRDVFQHPRSEFVAKFIGIKNVLKGELIRSDNGLAQFIYRDMQFFVLSDKSPCAGFLIIREEDVTVSRDNPSTSARNSYEGAVLDVVSDRQRIEVTVDIGIEITALITQDSMAKLELKTGSTVWVQFKASAARFIEE